MILTIDETQKIMLDTSNEVLKEVINFINENDCHTTQLEVVTTPSRFLNSNTLETYEHFEIKVKSSGADLFCIVGNRQDNVLITLTNKMENDEKQNKLQLHTFSYTQIKKWIIDQLKTLL